MSDKPQTGSSSFQRVTRDLLDLLELQLELLSVDSQEAKRMMSTAVICGLVAATLAGSALTVLMIGGGVLLDELTQLSTGGSLLIVSAGVFFVVAIFGWFTLRAMQQAASAMSETKSEFIENLRWLKATLISPQTSPRNQIRRDSFDDFPDGSIPDSSRQSDWNGSSGTDRESTPTYRR